MKKILTLLALILVVATGCKSQSASAEAKKLAEGGVEYEYRAYTRGTELSITMQSNEILAYKGRPTNDIAIPVKEMPQKDWNALLEQTAKIDLDKLETLEAPTKKHQFDGAMAASLKITANGKTYQSVTFDHGNPPAEIKSLVEKIIQLSELEKQ